MAASCRPVENCLLSTPRIDHQFNARNRNSLSSIELIETLADSGNEMNFLGDFLKRIVIRDTFEEMADEFLVAHDSHCERRPFFHKSN